MLILVWRAVERLILILAHPSSGGQEQAGAGTGRRSAAPAHARGIDARPCANARTPSPRRWRGHRAARRRRGAPSTIDRPGLFLRGTRSFPGNRTERRIYRQRWRRDSSRRGGAQTHEHPERGSDAAAARRARERPTRHQDARLLPWVRADPPTTQPAVSMTHTPHQLLIQEREEKAPAAR